MAISEAVNRAIKMETDAISFYTDAASRTSHPLGKKMFESLILDEKRHLRMLEGILKGMEMDFEMKVIGDVKTVFSDFKDQMMQRIQATTDEKEAIKIALEMEKEGFHYYQEVAGKATDSRERKLFEILTREEESHYQLLNNTYSFLEDTGNWFMWDELSIVEGG